MPGLFAKRQTVVQQLPVFLLASLRSAKETYRPVRPIAAVTDSIVLNPQQRALIPTGLIMAIPQGYEGQIRPRSGLAIKHGITVLNSPGTIDSDYRDEVKVILINLGELPFEVTRGMRIAQLVIAKYQTVEFSTEPNIVKLSGRRGP